VAAEKDLESLSANASPFAVRRARVKTARREQSAAKEMPSWIIAALASYAKVKVFSNGSALSSAILRAE
jgi:hypothetical protein